MTTTPIPTDLLAKSELLPDGRVTTNAQEFLQAWAAFTQKQIMSGKLKIYDIEEYDPDTGMVPNSFIMKIYTENRKLQ